MLRFPSLLKTIGIGCYPRMSAQCYKEDAYSVKDAWPRNSMKRCKLLVRVVRYAYLEECDDAAAPAGRDHMCCSNLI